MDSLISWRGGKSRLAKKIVSLFPEHICYIETFGGAAWVLFAKPEEMSKHEVLNDRHAELMNFWEVVRTKRIELFNAMQYDIKSRFIYNQLRKVNIDELSDVERARRFYWMCKCSFGGTYEDVFGTSRKGAAPAGFDKFEKRLLIANQRLKKVTIEHKDYRDLSKLYDHTTSLWYCVPGETLVLSKNFFSSINTLNIGDNLDNGNYVTAIHKRKVCNESLIRLQVMGLGSAFPILASADHKLFKLDNNNSIVESKCSDLCIGDRLLIESDRITESYLPIYEHVTMPKGKRKNTVFSFDMKKLAQLLGFFTAEGHYQDGLIFSFSVKESIFLTETYGLIKNLFDVNAFIHKGKPHPSVSQVEVFGRDIENYFRKFIQGNAVSKRFADFVLYWPSDIQLEILKYWLKGDGGVYEIKELNPNPKFKRSGRRNKFKITGTTASFNLLCQMYCMALRCKLHPCIKRRISKLNGKDFIAYDLYFTCLQDINILTENNISGRSCKRRHWIGNFLSTPITKISRLDYTGEMYDLTTREGYFLIGMGVKSHNCDPPYLNTIKTGYANAML